MSTAPKKQDQLFLEGIKKGDNQIIRQVYEQYFDRIAIFIKNNKGADNDALDIFQEALMVVYQKTQQDSFHLTSTLFTYLYAISKNLWFKQLKKNKLFERTIADNPVLIEDEEIIASINERERYELYRKKFHLLHEDCQQLLNLFFEGISMREIAEKMKITEKYARKKKFNCKSKLIEAIKKDISYQELRENG